MSLVRGNGGRNDASFMFHWEADSLSRCNIPGQRGSIVAAGDQSAFIGEKQGVVGLHFVFSMEAFNEAVRLEDRKCPISSDDAKEFSRRTEHGCVNVGHGGNPNVFGKEIGLTWLGGDRTCSVVNERDIKDASRQNKMLFSVGGKIDQ